MFSLIQVIRYHKMSMRYSVSSQLYYRNAILAFKCMCGRAPEYLSTFFTKRSDVNRFTTRSLQLLNVPLFKTASGQRAFLLPNCQHLEFLGIEFH